MTEWSSPNLNSTCSISARLERKLTKGELNSKWFQLSSCIHCASAAASLGSRSWHSRLAERTQLSDGRAEYRICQAEMEPCLHSCWQLMKKLLCTPAFIWTKNNTQKWLILSKNSHVLLRQPWSSGSELMVLWHCRRSSKRQREVILCPEQSCPPFCCYCRSFPPFLFLPCFNLFIFHKYLLFSLPCFPVFLSLLWKKCPLCSFPCYQWALLPGTWQDLCSSYIPC